MKKLFSFSLLITLIAGLFWGCEEKKPDPPVLPPAESMIIDFSNFITTKKSAFTEGEVKGISAVDNSNWALASTIAGFWNLILAVNIAVPVAAFHVAVENQPVYLENKKWEWKYSVNVVGAAYKARMTGQIRDTDIKWEMYVAKEGVGAYAEFLWFEGTTKLDGKSGQWILNHSQQFQEPMLQIDWTLNGSDVGSVKYTYIRDLKDNRTTEPFKNSYIEYGLTTNTLNAFYNVHFFESTILNAFVDASIEWSTTNHNGRIKAFYFFQDNNWHCWDGNGNNVTCN
jgi:hypothetical protein